MDNKKELLGVILCGGQSSRMGQDKGLMQHQGQSWAALAAQKLSFFVNECVFSVNNNQIQAYKHLFSDAVVVDDVILSGPLNGILSVHKNLPQYDLFVLASDMVLIDSYSLSLVYKHYAKTRVHYDIWLPQLPVNQQDLDCNDVHYEPLCAIYSNRFLSYYLEQVRNWQNEWSPNRKEKRFSLYRAIAGAKILPIAFAGTESGVFSNFNSKEDLRIIL